MSDAVDVRADGLQQLCQAPPVPELAELASRHPATVAVVGGAIRDALLGLPYDDLDVVVVDDLAGFVRFVEELRGRRPASIGDRFQDTRRCIWRGVQVDISSCQGTLRQDLARRDFTVNSMALPLPSEGASWDDLVDPQGGLDDLRAGRIRCNRPEVLEADPLRLLRAVRYAAVLPGFALTAEAEAQVRRRVHRISDVSPERVQLEWRRLLSGDSWVDGLELAVQLGLDAATIGEVGEVSACRAWARSELERRGEVEEARLAALLVDIASLSSDVETPAALAPAFRERRWPRRLVSTASTAASWARDLGALDDEERAERALAAPRVADLAARLGEALAPEAAAAARSQRRLAARALERRWVSGDDLLGWGMPEGRQLGELLDEVAVGQVLRRWSGAEEARLWARRRAGELAGGTG